MDKEIKNFLKDLYKLDPDLKNQEQELIKLIHQMMASRPDVKFDEKFARSLRDSILKKSQKKKGFNFISNFNYMKKFAYIGGGAVLCAVLFLAVYQPWSSDQEDRVNLGLGDLKVSQLPAESFGALELKGQDVSATDGRGAGGSDGSMESLPTSPSKIGMPAPVNYQYVYNGPDFELEAGEALVYKYQKPKESSRELAELFEDTDFGLVDINKFENLGLQNITFIEDKEFGYSININLENGMVNIGENWTKWEKSGAQAICVGEDCDSPLTISDVPNNEDLIAMADNFIKEYGINRNNYGQPIVRDEWRARYERNNEEGRAYIPESMQITYPLMIDGQEVYDQGGYPVGLSINVNIREQKVSGIYGLRVENYQSSAYELETDMNKLIASAEDGGIYSSYSEESEDAIQIELGKPEIKLIRVYNYQNNQQEEILVPGLMFDVLDAPDNYYGRPKVVVLLVEGVVEREEPVFRIME